MASTSNLSNDITALYRDYYELKSLSEREFNNGLLTYGQKGVIPKNQSDVIHFHRWQKFALAGTVNENADPLTGISAGADEVKMQLEHLASYIEISNFGDKVRLVSLVKESYTKFIEQVQRSVNRRLMTVLANGDSTGSNSISAGTKRYGNGKASFAALGGTDYLKTKDLQAAIALLEQQGARRPYTILLNPWSKADLMIEDQEFRDLLKYTSFDILKKNELPMWAGARIDMQDEPWRESSTEGTYDGSGGVVSTYVFGAESFGSAQLFGDTGLRPKFKAQDITKTGAATTIGWRLPYKGGCLQSQWFVQIRSNTRDYSVASVS